MLKKPRIITYDADFDREFYEDRVNRNGCFMGIDAEQQKASQEKLLNSTIGIAGCGGIGGLLAMTMARMGVGHIKLADPDSFEASNINRQVGAGQSTLGQNKAIVVGDEVRRMVKDVKLEMFPEGINTYTAKPFVEGCDLVFDQTDVFLTTERYALHDAFQEHERTKCILASCVWGFGANIYKFERGGVTYQDLLGIPPGKAHDEDDIERMIVQQLDYMPRFPSLSYILNWMEELGNVPIHAATPPLSCYLLAVRAFFILADLERQPYCEPLPPIPKYRYYDAANWDNVEMEFDGTYKNPTLHAELFNDSKGK